MGRRIVLLASTLMVVAFVGTYASAAIPAGLDPRPEEACEGDRPWLATTCFWAGQGVPRIDPRSASIVVGRDTPSNRPQYMLADFNAVGTVWGLAYAEDRGEIFAAAFHKRQRPFGPAGPGGIYRIEIDDGTVTPFVTVPNAGPDRHGNQLAQDRGGGEWVGRTSLGDIDISADEDRLFVVNLADRHVYVFSVADGTQIARFPHGASGETWSDEARPFALAVHQGMLYHGLVRSAEDSGAPDDLGIYVYRSRFDGSDMTQVLGEPLNHERGAVRVSSSGVLGVVRVDWLPWQKHEMGRIVLRQVFQPDVNVAPQPLLADLEVTSSGDLLLGIRDRNTDVQLTDVVHADGAVGIGIGDVLHAIDAGDGTFALSDPPTFDSILFPTTEILPGGGLSVMDSGGNVVAGGFGSERSGIAASSPQDVGEGLFWLDPRSGSRVAAELTCDPVWVRPWPEGGVRRAFGAPSRHSEGVPINMYTVGDVEHLCGEDVVPTPTGVPSTTPTASNTPSPVPVVTLTQVPTPTPTITPEPTVTPVLEPVYLPVLLRERCAPADRRVDLVVVLDSSTSMGEPAVSGRRKIEAAREAVEWLPDRLDLPAGDRMSVVTFNSAARTLIGWSSDRGAIVGAMGEIELSPGTCISCGLEAAEVLLVERDASRSLPVVLVLTDGQSNPQPIEVAIERAEDLKALGALIFTVGVGQDVDAAGLEAMASRPAYHYRVADADALPALFREIAGTIPCPASAFWGGR